MNLKQLGWNENLENQFNEYKNQGYTVGRVAVESKGSYRLFTEEGTLHAEVTGKMRFQAASREDFPAVGDWVVIQARPNEGKATIHAVLPRTSKFSRKVAGETTEVQIVATNIDTVFLVTALNHDFNVRRIERYLLMAWESGANPIVVLSKADLCEDIEEKIAEVESVAFGVPIIVISSLENQGFEQISPYMTEGKTVALLGSSGVGKSTLINRLYGEDIQKVKEVREDDSRGRHTTTHREMILLPNGGIIIDTPGMRELQLWEAGDSFDHSFSDVEAIAERCQFRDCQHDTEPNCAIKEALETGELDEGRYQNYLKLQKELAFLERKNDKRLELEERKKWKKLAGDRTRVHRK